MCEPGRYLKLCTCGDGAPPSKPRWRIARQTARDARINADRMNVVGSFVLPPLEKRLLLDLVRRDVNRADAFDIDPQAEEGDVLTLEFETETIAFVFHDGRWEEDGVIGTEASANRSRGGIETTG